MIVDRLDNAAAYRALSPRLAAALDYLKANDFSRIETGKYIIDGDNVFAMVQRYRSRSLSQIVWESHRKYIDVQFVAQGHERMGYAPLAGKPKVKQAYDEGNDAALYDTEGSLIEYPAGTFAIFSPQDVHAPGLAAGTPPVPSDVVKVVVKVKVDPAKGPCGF